MASGATHVRVGSAIFGTRPWLVYGESSVKVRGGHFAEDYRYNAREIRFTTKEGNLDGFEYSIMKAIADTGFKGHVAQEFIPKRPDALASLKQGVNICDV